MFVCSRAKRDLGFIGVAHNIRPDHRLLHIVQNAPCLREASPQKAGVQSNVLVGCHLAALAKRRPGRSQDALYFN
jgi:hypothetical protein